MTHMMKLAHFAYSDIKNMAHWLPDVSHTKNIHSVKLFVATTKRREDIGKLVSPLLLVMNIDYVPLFEEYPICIE